MPQYSAQAHQVTPGSQLPGAPALAAASSCLAACAPGSNSSSTCGAAGSAHTAPCVQVYVVNTNRTDVLLLVGAIYYQLGNYEQCIAFNDRCILLDPHMVSWRALVCGGSASVCALLMVPDRYFETAAASLPQRAWVQWSKHGCSEAPADLPPMSLLPVRGTCSFFPASSSAL